jgi:hypothetical protein
VGKRPSRRKITTLGIERAIFGRRRDEIAELGEDQAEKIS